MDNNKPQNKDEISIIDLFAIFIKYRKLIIIGTLISFLFCSAYFIIKPILRNKNTNPVSYTTTIGITLEKNLSSNIVNLPTTDYEAFVANIILQPQNQFTALVQSKYYTSDSLDTYKYCLFTHYSKIFIVKPEANSYNKYTIYFTNKDSEKSINFAKSFIKELNNIIYLYFSDLAKEELIKTKNEIQNYSSKSSNAYMFLLEKEKELSKVINNNINILTYTSKNVNTIQNYPPKEKISIKKIIISLFGCLFIFIIVALIKNYFVNLTSDPSQKEKLHKAWIDGK